MSLTVDQKKGLAEVDRALARGRIAAAEAASWRGMVERGADPRPALAMLHDDPGRIGPNVVAASAAQTGTTGSAAPSPELLRALGFPVAASGGVAGAGPEFGR